MSEQKVSLLIVDDDDVDAEVVKRLVQRRGLKFDLFVAMDGDDALRQLGNLPDGEHKNWLILLDLNMPGMNGHEFLSAIRADANLSRLLVFVLTTSNYAPDKRRAYDRNIAGYFLKSNVDGLMDTLESYTTHVEFPPLETGTP